MKNKIFGINKTFNLTSLLFILCLCSGAIYYRLLKMKTNSEVSEF